MSGQVTAVRRRLLQSLGVDLDQPYFTVVTGFNYMATKRCQHLDYGVTLDEVARTATCKGCQQPVDAFDALRHYAASEQRLVRHAEAIQAAERREAADKQRDKDRRPFKQAVVSRVARKDLTLKAEPIIGYTLTLACGHVADCGPEQRMKFKTCGVCQQAAAKAAKP